MQFIQNTHPNFMSERSPYLTVTELIDAENYGVSVPQKECFTEEFGLLKVNSAHPKSNHLLPLQPFIDQGDSCHCLTESII